MTRVNTIENLLRVIIEGTSSETGEGFFNALVKSIACALGFKYALVAKIKPFDKAETLAVWSDGDYGENFSYSLKGTPCAKVSENSVCIYPDNIQSLFPEDELLEQLGVLSYVGAPLIDSSNTTHGILVILDDKPLKDTDIAEDIVKIFASRASAELARLNAEEEKDKTSKDWEFVFETINDAILVIDNNFNVERANSAALDLLQVNPELLFKNKCYSSVHGQSCPPQLCPSCDVINTQVPITTECYEPYLKKYLEVKALPIIDESGKSKGLIHVIRDISQRKHDEDAREELVQQLERRNQELERFAYTVSHDLKTPLVTISNFAGIIKNNIQKLDDNELNQDFSFIEHSVAKMGLLLEGLLSLAHVGKATNDVMPLVIKDVFDEFITNNGKLLESCKVRVTIPENIPKVLGDPCRIEEVIQNLIENAVKFSSNESQPQIDIGCSTLENEVHCYIRDNGIGVPAEYQRKVFNLFEKLEPSFEGQGVGLSIVKKIINEHRGSVWVDSNCEKKETTFWFSLPVDTTSQDSE